jgi:hypothetical protein
MERLTNPTSTGFTPQKSKLFPPPSIVLLQSLSERQGETADGLPNEVRGDELRALLDRFTADLSIDALRTLALIKNSEWETIVLWEIKYRDCLVTDSGTVSDADKLTLQHQRSGVMTATQGAWLDTVSNAGLTCALSMAGCGDLQWAFADRFAMRNTVWFCTGDTDTLVDWLLTLHTSPRADYVFVGYHEDEAVFNNTVTQRTFRTVASFTCSEDICRLQQVRAIVAWLRACPQPPHPAQLTVLLGWQAIDDYETIELAEFGLNQMPASSKV